MLNENLCHEGLFVLILFGETLLKVNRNRLRVFLFKCEGICFIQ